MAESGRGSGFSRSENEYIVAKCLRAIYGKEPIKDIDIAETLGRGKNNIAIRRRKLGFMYKNDAETGESKVIYKKPKSKSYYINIDRIDVNRSIAVIEMKVARKEMLERGENVEGLKVSDFYPDSDFDQYSEEQTISMSNNIDVCGADANKKDEDDFLTDYDDNDVKEHFKADRFENEEEEEEEKPEIEETVVDSSYFDGVESDDKEDKDGDEEEIEESEEDKKMFSSYGFSSILKSFNLDEKNYFKSRWKSYMGAYGDQFDEVSDWDDLVGYLSEQIKRNRLLKKEKDYEEDYSKELSLCIGRLNDYKKNLATSRISRIQQKVDTSLNVADLIKSFEDNPSYIELNYLAEKELNSISEYIREFLITPENLKDFSKIDGNEAALLLGLPSSYEELSKLMEKD